ncbi:MAG: BamA/TamA family outer membrane protein [Candidatus Binatia bacterium]|nr:BamA/TamA family outer membrane protein [Candidatus Binatia bacterium]
MFRVWASRAAVLVAGVMLLATAQPPLSLAEEAAGGESAPRTVSLSDFDIRGPWRLTGVSIEGLGWFEAWTIGSSLQTQARPWWSFWSDHPAFVPAYLYGDLDMIRSRMQAEGYYRAFVEEKIVIVKPPGRRPSLAKEGTPGEIEVRIEVDPGLPVVVCSLYVDLETVTLPADSAAEIAKKFPLEVGQPFTRAGYQAAAQRYAQYLADHGYPQATVERHARVDVLSRCAEVAYGLAAGPHAVFGKTTLSGLTTIPDEIALREVAYEAGKQYDEKRMRETQSRLRGTRLFSVVRVEKGKVTDDGEVPVGIELTEGPPHEIRLGVGYGTDDGVRGLASWWNYNFLGGNRRLGFSTRISRINRWVEASFVQPHFPRRRDTASISFTLGQQDESTYLDNSFVATPKVSWWINKNATATTYYTFRYDSLSDVTDETVADLGPAGQFQNSGFTSTIGLGMRWLGFNDPANPTSGLGLALAGELSGGRLGADFDLFRLLGQAAYYQPLWGDLVFAVTLRGGSIVPYDETPQVPLWARLYAGGNASFPLRGYGRRRVGPLSGSDDPLGGRTAIVTTTELLYPIGGPVLGVLFFDAGDVELSAWTIKPENVQKGVGAGLRAVTPVGPVEIDFGFGLDHPAGDSVFQVNFTIGPQF